MLRRDQAYLGVLVDDRITRGVQEPYRMFTSRAEYRLSLREDNADMRLTEIGRQLGLVDDQRWDIFCRKRDAVSRETLRLHQTWINPSNFPDDAAQAILGKNIEREYSLADLLRRPEVSYRTLTSIVDQRFSPKEALDADKHIHEQIGEQVEISIKYQGYIARQADEIARQLNHEKTHLPLDLDYTQVRGLSSEVVQKLNAFKPATFGQATRISGVTPAAISLLLVYLKKTVGRSAPKLS